jgi:hypothetical protein
MTRIKTEGLKERKQSPLRYIAPDVFSSAVASKNDETKIMANSSAVVDINNNRFSRMNSFQRSTTPVLEMIETASYSISEDDGNDNNDVVSLSFSGSDETTVNSDDSDTTSISGGSKRRRRRNKQSKQEDKQEQSYTNAKTVKECDVGKYMAGREMTPFQERMNAVTVMPGAFYCIMILLSGRWLSKSIIEGNEYDTMYDNINNALFDDSQCISWKWLPNLHALPPLPPVAAAMGIVLHAPFSFIYHWRYAHRLPPGLARTTHWSRRMDQAMIHFCSACMSYATSGRLDFFLVNFLYNADCFYRQFLTRVQPQRNQMRIGISVLAYSIPILRRGEFLLCSKLGVLFGISGWFFRKYPIGGWSHSVFHIFLAFIPPILMSAALELPASQSQLRVAVHCASLAKGLVS